MKAAGPSYDILKRFPYEIWSKCVLSAIYRAPEGPLPFLGVSSHWQKLLLDSPEMWSYIHIEGDDIAAGVHTFLHLSRQRPLELGSTFSGSLWTSMIPTILPHKERVHSIYMLEWPYHTPEWLIDPLGQITFPEVRTIETNRFSSNASAFGPLLTLCPNLQHSLSTVFSIEEDFKWIRQSLRTIDVRCADKTVQSLMMRARPILDLSNLELLNILLEIGDADPETSSTQYPPDAFVLSSKMVRHLSLDINVPTILQGLLSSSFKELSTLYITMSVRNIDFIINSLRSLPSLQTLSLTLSNETYITSCPPLWPSDIPKLRTLRIHVNYVRVSFDVLFNILTKNDVLVGVEDFEFIRGRVPVDSIQLVDLLCLLHSLRNTMRMTLPVFELEEVDLGADLGFKVPIHMPNLLHLRISFLNPISFINAPSLHSLEIPSSPKASTKPIRIPNGFARDITTLQITGEAFDNFVIEQANHWDSVKKVIWTYDQSFVGSKTTRFRSICSVEFRRVTFRGAVYNRIGKFNTLLIALLRYPDACPHLHTIKSDKYPTWSLLTQVMLQRKRNNNIAQLEDIWLPNLPIQPILSFVVGLLRNTSTEVIPPRLDEILMRRLQHVMFPGCDLCISAGYRYCVYQPPPDYSSLWWQTREDGSKHDRRSDEDYLELLEYGLDEKVEEGCQEMDWKAWERRLESMAVRRKESPNETDMGCRRHERMAELKRIHKYILYH